MIKSAQGRRISHIPDSVKYDGSVLSGINEVRKYNICLAAGSKNLVKEINNYRKSR
jgi:hypothetical protein